MERDQLRLLHAELLRDEGLRLKPYRDRKGYLTIGIGRNLDTVGISVEESHLLCLHDMERAEKALNTHCPWWGQLDPVRQRVLVNMTFNLGIQKLCGFTQFLEALQHQDYERAAGAMLDSRWAEQVQARATRLADMMRRGKTASL